VPLPSDLGTERDQLELPDEVGLVLLAGDEQRRIEVELDPVELRHLRRDGDPATFCRARGGGRAGGSE
jgi:hypothetical protein